MEHRIHILIKADGKMSSRAVFLYKRKTRALISSLLRKICSIGDTYEQHKENLNYKSFLDIQLKLVKRIMETERRITKLRTEKPNDLDEIEETKQRRKLLKLLGTTIAWMMLEFDRSYIRNFARGHAPGFIIGKKGFELELLALKTAFEFRNSAAVLHDITNCLLIGDLSVVSPKGILTLELKLKKEKKKADRRERRQKRKAKIIREFYDKGISTKIIPGLKSIRHISEKRDKHNWNELSTVIAEAFKNGYGISIVEKCCIYCAFKNDGPIDKVISYVELFKDPCFMFGCHDRHIDPGLPSMMPFTCFEIPFSYKEKLLFREINFCIMIDVNSLRRIIQENGYNCRITKSSDGLILEVSSITREKEYVQISEGLIGRLLYECLSVETFINYIKEVLEKLTKSEI